jgi:NADPH:quinone reductase-like Zn-dependent oxidoreductase
MKISLFPKGDLDAIVVYRSLTAGVSTEQGLEWAAESTRALWPIARELDIVLALENHYKDGYWSYPEFAQKREVFLALLSQIDDRVHFGVQSDPSNATVAGDDPVDFLKTVIDRVVTMQASDRTLAPGATLLVAEPRALHRIPDAVSFEKAAMTEPYCVAFNALVQRASVKAGDIVVIQGVGAIGSLSVQIAKLQGASTVVVVGTSLDRRRLAKALTFGADHAVELGLDDPILLLRRLGDGFGADVVVDATGVSAALAQSLEFVRPLGSIAKIGWGPQPLGFSLDPLVAKAVTMYGCFSHTWDTWERVLAALKRCPHDQVMKGYAGIHLSMAFRWTQRQVRQRVVQHGAA